MVHLTSLRSEFTQDQGIIDWSLNVKLINSIKLNNIILNEC